MKILFHNFYDSLNKGNFLFNELNTSIGDNLLAPFHRLASFAHSRNILVGTSDVIAVSEADALVFLDNPDLSNPKVQLMLKAEVPKYLIVFESPLVRQLPSTDSLLQVFDRIFTYDDSMVNGDRVLKINYSFDFLEPITSPPKSTKKLITLIAGNKSINVCGELYSKRLEAIHWFEKNAPQDFDLYGVGWNMLDFGTGFPWRFLNRFRSLRMLLAPRLRTYRGSVLRKKPALSQYQFAICYENVENIPGYITEKIFDCFLAGCIPVYWGAKNITDHIPENCFINKANFISYEDLLKFLVRMGDDTYQTYLRNINDFIHGEKGYAFSTEHFSRTIVDTICEDIQRLSN